MKKLLACAALSGCAVTVQAQSSNVTLYGVIDGGLSRSSNVNGKSLNAVDTGILSPNIIGIRGSEDLGDGMRAFFRLQSQFQMDSGAQVGNLWGHYAGVGLEGRFGQIQAGNLNDFMFTTLTQKTYGPMFPFVSIQFMRRGPFDGFGRPGGQSPSADFDRTGNTSRIGNAVRYDSPRVYGVQLGALYGFGESTTAGTNNSSSKSYSADYTGGPVTLTAAYTSVNYAALGNGEDGVRTWGAGARYDFGDGVHWSGVYTNSRNTANDARIGAFATALLFSPTTNTRAIGQYTYMKGNEVLTNNKAHQVNLSLHYLFSKRTNVYTSFGWQHATGDAEKVQAALMASAGAASGSSQNILRVGMQHAF
ncbi:porin [Derxia gummosa]|uniref:Porin n=1 Tax=Derxia gummosa DSM 723 TaxID=1121388 RepID=A0A8B6X3Z0_9BURK|nr:porin [Derxia gummosa]